MFWDSMARRGKLKISYHFNKPWTVRDLAEIESIVNGCIVAILREWDVKMGRRPIGKRRRLFRVDLHSAHETEDGLDPKTNLVVTMDFARLLGPLPATKTA
jgi:hypothetical protein